MSEYQDNGNIHHQMSEVPCLIAESSSYVWKWDEDCNKEKNKADYSSQVFSKIKESYKLRGTWNPVMFCIAYGDQKRMHDEENEDAITNPSMDFIHLVKTKELLKPGDATNEDKFNENEKLAKQPCNSSEADEGISTLPACDERARMIPPQENNGEQVDSSKEVY